MWRNKLSIQIRSYRELCNIAIQSVYITPSHPNSPSRVKSKSSGNSFPLGIRAPSTRNSSKKGWIIASTALSRAPGVYSNNFDTRSIASGAVRGRKTLTVCMMSSYTKYTTRPRTYFRERMWLDLWKLVFHIIRIHRLDLLPRRRPKDLDDLHQLIYAAFSRKQRLSQHQLRHHTSC
jgi:hypothetical protein